MALAMDNANYIVFVLIATQIWDYWSDVRFAISLILDTLNNETDSDDNNDNEVFHFDVLFSDCCHNICNCSCMT